MPVEVVDEVGENEGRRADEVDDKSEEENGTDDLKCLDWLVNYRLPEYFGTLDDSFHQFTEKNLFRNSNDGSVSEEILYYEDEDQVTEQMICDTPTATEKCSLLCWIYQVLATSPERQLSLNDIYHRFLVLNPDCEKLSSNWKFSVRETLLNSKCFIYKHSLWSINADFALKHERDALAEGLSHRCPTYEVGDTSNKRCIRNL
uniref:Fork-head domain-containing protein n=1 Tax=Elaeophora elaphi TaxID=1147741 RepID=A0A0R3RXM7_9BILA